VETQSRLNQSIVILDFGAQTTQLIARRIREQNVFSVVLPCTASLDEVKSYAPVGIVLSGAPWSVYDKDAPPADPRVFETGTACARHLLRAAVHGAHARRQSAAGG
jgi:GMP synthase-like glutamine amidotransferase